MLINFNYLYFWVVYMKVEWMLITIKCVYYIRNIISEDNFQNNLKQYNLLFTDLDIAKAWVATRIRHSFSSSPQRKSFLFYTYKINS